MVDEKNPLRLRKRAIRFHVIATQVALVGLVCLVFTWLLFTKNSTWTWVSAGIVVLLGVTAITFQIKVFLAESQYEALIKKTSLASGRKHV